MVPARKSLTLLLGTVSLVCVGRCGGPNTTLPDGGTIPDGSYSPDGGNSPDGGTNSDGGSLVPGFNTPVRIGTARSTASTSIHAVDVALNEAGVALAGWDEDGDTTGSAWVAWYRAGAWETAGKVTDGFTKANLPRVALNDSGAAAVVFEVVEYQGGGVASSTIWARRWVGGSWTAAERVSEAPAGPNEFYARDPRTGVDGAGHIVVTWLQTKPSSTVPESVYANRFDGAAWSGPTLISSGTLHASSSDVAVSASGSATVVWVQSTNPSGGGPTNPNIWARQFDGTSWLSEVRIGADLSDYEGCERPKVVTNGQGRTFAIWEERRRTEIRISSARFEPGGTWTASEILDRSNSSSNNLSFPDIATSGQGGAFAVWLSDAPDGGTTRGGSARLDSSSGWRVAQEFENSAEVRAAVSAMDGIGNAWAIFSTDKMYARKQDASGGWQSPQSIGSSVPTAVDTNSSGMMIIAGYEAFYQYNPPAFLVAANAVIYVP